MAITIKLFEKDPNEILEIVRSIRDMGLVQGKDFDFAYHKTEWDNMTYEPAVRQHTVFTFYTEKWASWFTLRWS